MRILNLGAGVQSTTVYLLSLDGKIDPIDYAIFADTQEEPGAVYRHLKWLQSLGGPPILIRSVGKLGDDLLKEKNSTSQRFASIPAYSTSVPHVQRGGPVPACSVGLMRRQCTREYKIDVVEKTIRRDIYGLKPRKRFPKGTLVTQLFGISVDESKRAKRIKKRIEMVKWSSASFPLLDLEWTRADCQKYLEGRVPHEVPRPACVFCPYHKNEEWARLKREDPEGWNRAVEVDAGLRRPGAVVNRKLNNTLYLHRSCLPLPLIDFDANLGPEINRFAALDCGEGMCGI